MLTRSSGQADARPPGHAVPPRIYVFLTLAMVFWGGTFVAGRFLSSQVEPAVSALLRFALATLLLWLWMLRQTRGIPRLSRYQWAGVSLLGLSGIAAYNLFFFEGLKAVEAGRAALIVAINPVVIALVSRLLVGEALGWKGLLGAATSLVGAVIVIARGDLPALLAQGAGTGEWLLVGCVVSWSLYTLIGRRMLLGLSPLLVVAHASLVGTLLLAGVVAMQGSQVVIWPTDYQSWLSILYLALFGTVMAFVWYYSGVHAIGATRASQFINLVPVSGVLLGALVLAEPLTPAVLIGGGLVVMGLWLTNQTVRRETQFER